MIRSTEQALDRGLMKTVDWKLIICYVLIVLFGWINIYAAVRSFNPSSIFDITQNCGKQAIWIASAFLLATLILFVIPPRLWEALTTPAYGIVLGLLVLVIFVSSNVKGSHSWFSFGPISFQPAELSKITMSLMLAQIMSKPNFRMANTSDFIKVAIALGLPMLAILGENETGSALVYIGFVFALYREGLSGWLLALMGLMVVLFIATLTTSWWVSLIILLVFCLVFFLPSFRETRSVRLKLIHIRKTMAILIVGAAMIFATDFVFDNVLKAHQRKRVEVLLGMKEDPQGVGYNVRQSMIAIGSGGFAGKGYLNGTQTTYGFVPEQSTDFIFCTVGEEWGFMGCFFLIVLYALLITWIIQDADKARGAFVRIYGYCVASCLFMHLFINIGMTVGLMPVIGIPLPLFSYGGSSLWSFTTMIFIFIAMDRAEKKYF